MTALISAASSGSAAFPTAPIQRSPSISPGRRSIEPGRSSTDGCRRRRTVQRCIPPARPCHAAPGIAHRRLPAAWQRAAPMLDVRGGGAASARRDSGDEAPNQSSRLRIYPHWKNAAWPRARASSAASSISLELPAGQVGISVTSFFAQRFGDKFRKIQQQSRRATARACRRKTSCMRRGPCLREECPAADKEHRRVPVSSRAWA